MSEIPHYVIRDSADGKFYFVLEAENDKVVLTSETYYYKSSAITGIESVKVNSPIDARYDRRISVNKEPYFVLKGGNGEIIGTSEMYSSTYAMEDGIKVVKRIGPIAQTIDISKK